MARGSNFSFGEDAFARYFSDENTSRLELGTFFGISANSLPRYLFFLRQVTGSFSQKAVRLHFIRPKFQIPQKNEPSHHGEHCRTRWSKVKENDLKLISNKSVFGIFCSALETPVFQTALSTSRGAITKYCRRRMKPFPRWGRISFKKGRTARSGWCPKIIELKASHKYSPSQLSFLQVLVPTSFRKKINLTKTPGFYTFSVPLGSMSGVFSYTGVHKINDNFIVARYEWVAWKNDSLGGPGRPVELVFEFDSLRNFSAMHLHTNNFFSKGVQVFSSAKVYLSIGGKLFSGLPIEYQYMPDTIMEHARNVTIKLHHVIGRFLKVQLYFESQWIMVSEVSFDSVVVPGNVTEEYFENNYVGAAQDVKDVPLQRDAVHSTLSKHEPGKAVGTSSVVSGGSPPKEPESKQLVGLLIGALTSVILLLLVAIVFIVFHSRNAKNSLSHASTDQFTAEKAMTEMVANKGHVYGQVGSTEDSEKGILYHEPFASANMYGLHPTTRSAEYADVPDIMQEYAVPLVSQPPSFYTSVPPQTPLRSLPPLHNFFPKPPPVPPPPEKYYAATEIVQKAPPVPSSPPPPSVSHSSSSASSSAYGQILHPPSSESRPSATADLQLNSIPRSDLKYLTKLGIGHFGEVSNFPLSERKFDNIPEILGSYSSMLTFISSFFKVHLVEVLRKTSWSRSCSSKYVVVKALHKDSPLSLRESFEREMEELLPLNHENISCVLGACFDQAPPLLVMEYTEHGDLYQFLQNHVAESTSLPHSHAETLSYGSLIYMASQIAAGMKYLEQKNYILNDLATRNCIVGDDYRVKIADFGVSPHVYPSDYVELPGRGACPIRWMAWETIVLSKCTSRSVVWSFAVTLWEILTFAREQPFEDLTDEKVLENAKIFEKPNGKPITLAQPIGCHKEVYDLMCECWQRKEADRPTFKEIHMFLQRKNLGYKHQLRNS
ncbi:unnamed protein product [Nesidiocoris tenuis]|uniref:Protein kinase domain-containing protein n=1 Tax=Nesidiocoris tenuis TaxID=355587 RepID=A0A6H5GER0_9HEMI|nr:unnamed protein product [Nesidiocoris tenuis]